MELTLCTDHETLRDHIVGIVGNGANLTRDDLDHLADVYVDTLEYELERDSRVERVNRNRRFRDWRGGEFNHQAARYGHYIVAYGVCVLNGGGGNPNAQEVADEAFERAHKSAANEVRELASKISEENDKFDAEQAAEQAENEAE